MLGKETGTDAGSGPQQYRVCESDYEEVAGGSEWNAKTEEVSEEETHVEDEVVLARPAEEEAKAGEPTSETQNTKTRRAQGQDKARRRRGACACDATCGEAWWGKRWGLLLFVWLLCCVGASAGVS